MLTLMPILAAWGQVGFEAVVKEELLRVKSHFPLHRALQSGSYVLEHGVTVSVLGTTETAEALLLRVGFFFRSVIAGCSCADDPTPLNEHPEFAEFNLSIDKTSGETQIALREDEG